MRIVYSLAIALFMASATAAQNVPIYLSWMYEGLTSDITFRVYTSDSLNSTEWRLLATTQTLRVDLDVTPGVHFYRVTAVSAFWGTETPPSPVVATPSAPSIPSSLTIQRQ